MSAADASAPPAMSVESMYQEQGGACGEGYELRVQKVLGASCVCVAEGGCEGGREERTEAERSFGKAPEPAADEPPVGESGIRFTFQNKSE